MNLRTIVALAAISLPFVACGSAPPPYAALAIEDDAEMTSNVVVTDQALHDVVRVGRARVERVPGTNQLSVTVPIRNLDDRQIQILAQMSFLDRERAPIGDDTNRQVQLVSPGDTITFKAVSKGDAADDWLLRLSWNR